MNRLGIIGCGITGAVTASLLKEALPQLNISIIEKSRGTGGRMCTSRSSKEVPVDLGAQFITKTKDLSPLQERFYNELLQEGLIEPLHQTIEGLSSTSFTDSHYVCPGGSGSIVKYFLNRMNPREYDGTYVPFEITGLLNSLQKSNVEQTGSVRVFFNHRVKRIDPTNRKWLVNCDNGSNHEFDAVVLTIPVPQILQLEGLTSHFIDYYDKLETVQYSSRFALGLFYEESEFFSSIDNCAKFITGNPIIRFYSFDSKKRNASTLPTIVIHTTKEFGKLYIDKDSSMVQELILNEFNKLLPEVPKPTEIKFHKWRYSQVIKPFDGLHNCLLVAETPYLICGGDGFSYSTFEGCIKSAESIVQNIVKMNTDK